ncbi:hypothetical protein Y695_03710 [Hydrogenophaga sp. T4]|nr:hypothetical protein Y695_03710 [Hydrogenophaga sp. T4]
MSRSARSQVKEDVQIKKVERLCRAHSNIQPERICGANSAGREKLGGVKFMRANHDHPISTCTPDDDLLWVEPLRLPKHVCVSEVFSDARMN